VDAERRRLRKDGAFVFGGETLLVEGVPGLVQGAHQRGERVAEIEPRRDPHVADPEVRRERVRRLVLPARVEVVACRAQHVHRERPLPGLGPLLVEPRALGHPVRHGGARYEILLSRGQFLE